MSSLVICPLPSSLTVLSCLYSAQGQSHLSGSPWSSPVNLSSTTQGKGEERRGVRKEGREEGTEEGGKEGGRGGIHLSWAPILGEVLSFLQAILFNLHDKLGDCYYQRPLYMCKSG